MTENHRIILNDVSLVCTKNFIPQGFRISQAKFPVPRQHSLFRQKNACYFE
jgi:hypothetical protein